MYAAQFKLLKASLRGTRRSVIPMLCTVFVVTICGCQSPAARFQQQAEKQGMERRLEHELVVYQQHRLVDGEPIHIYLDGDGTPSPGRGRVSLDPTSRERLILKLIEADESASVLVGRPCYYGARTGCDPALWTSARYSAEVVRRISGAISGLLSDFPNSPVVLIGYSGGGTLAMLAAPSLARVDVLITIAANLDTTAWVEHHGYAPLTGSLNPAQASPLAASIQQFHLFGAEDANVPAYLARTTLERQSRATVEVVPDFDHRCCWPDIWASKLAAIKCVEMNDAN